MSGQGTFLDTLAAGQEQFISWCLPGSTTEQIIHAATGFNQFGQIIISFITLASGVMMCIVAYNTLLAFKYKESTRHDWLTLLGAFSVALLTSYIWDVFRVVHTFITTSESLILALYFTTIILNPLLIGYYLATGLYKFCVYSLRQLAALRQYIQNRGEK